MFLTFVSDIIMYLQMGSYWTSASNLSIRQHKRNAYMVVNSGEDNKMIKGVYL